MLKFIVSFMVVLVGVLAFFGNLANKKTNELLEYLQKEDTWGI